MSFGAQEKVLISVIPSSSTMGLCTPAPLEKSISNWCKISAFSVFVVPSGATIAKSGRAWLRKNSRVQACASWSITIDSRIAAIGDSPLNGLCGL